MKILELELHTRQLQTIKQFYTQVLELPLKSESENQFCVAAGTTSLYFTDNPERAGGCYHFAFRVPDKLFSDVVDKLQSKVNFIPDPQAGSDVIQHVEWQAQAVYFLDTEENIVEIIAHNTIPDHQDKSTLAAVPIVAVCEIGLAVPYVPDFAAELKTKLGLQRWKTANEKFEAAGNAEGLFILAEENRTWFPTKSGAAILPVRAVVDTPLKATIHADQYTISYI